MYFYRIEITFVRYFCIFLEVAGFENVVNFQNDQMIPFISFYFFFCLKDALFTRSWDAKHECILILVDKILRIFQAIVIHLFRLLRILYLNSIARRKMLKIGG